MRIALLSHALWRERERFGPQGGFLFQSAYAFQQRGHEVVAWSQHASKKEVDTFWEDEQGAPLFPVRLISAHQRKKTTAVLDKVSKWVWGHRKLATDVKALDRFLQDYGPFDALWAQTEAPDGTVGGALRWLRGKDSPPLLITVQAIRWQESLPGKITFTHHRGLGLGFRYAQKVAANSDLCAMWLEKHYGVPAEKRGRYRVNLTQSFLEAASSLSLKQPSLQEAPCVVFFGALNPTKGPDLFLQAAQLLAPQNPKAVFVMIGVPTEKNPAFERHLHELASTPELQGRVTWRGWLDPKELALELQKASVVACPSRVDTLSRAVLEALALGVPVVASEQVGAREILEKHACGLVATLAPPSLAQQIEKALQTRESLTDQAQKVSPHLLHHFSAQAAAQSIENLLLDLSGS